MFEQFSIIYDIHSWLRYLTWSALLLGAALLVWLAGGFPPHVWFLLAQTLPLSGHLLALRGPIIIFSLIALGIQSLTWLALWCLLLSISGTLLWRTLHVARTPSPSTSSWMPSSPRHPPLKKTGADDVHNKEEAHPAYLEGAALMQKSLHALEDIAQRTTQTVPATSLSQPMRAHAQASMTPAPPTSFKSATPTTPATSLRQFANTSSPIPTVEPISPLPPARPPRKGAHPTVPFPKTEEDIAEIPTPFKDTRNSAQRSSTGVPVSPITTIGLGWDPGLKRKGRPNEDSVATIRGTCTCNGQLLPFGLYIVTDGMGGHAYGQLASHLAIRSMLETVLPGILTCEQLNGELTAELIIDALIDGVHWANQVVYQYAYDHGVDMGTTITAALVLNSTAYVINVGDSRTYIFRSGAGLTQITRDHSLVARLVETGAIAPDDIYTHPERNKVYRGLGDKNEVTVDWFILTVQPGDLLLLCSDGLWEMVRDPHIAHILNTYAAAPTLASTALTRAALKAGGVDNVSVLVVKIGAES